MKLRANSYEKQVSKKIQEKMAAAEAQERISADAEMSALQVQQKAHEGAIELHAQMLAVDLERQREQSRQEAIKNNYPWGIDYLLRRHDLQSTYKKLQGRAVAAERKIVPLNLQEQELETETANARRVTLKIGQEVSVLLASANISPDAEVQVQNIKTTKRFFAQITETTYETVTSGWLMDMQGHLPAGKVVLCKDGHFLSGIGSVVKAGSTSGIDRFRAKANNIGYIDTDYTSDKIATNPPVSPARSRAHSILLYEQTLQEAAVGLLLKYDVPVVF